VGGSAAAVWISYADTGYGGSVLAPRNGSPTNLDSKQVITTVVESFEPALETNYGAVGTNVART